MHCTIVLHGMIDWTVVYCLACPSACRLEQYKWKAVVTEIKRIHKEGRPVLVGTTSVEKSELLSEMLAQDGIKHQVSDYNCWSQL